MLSAGNLSVGRNAHDAMRMTQCAMRRAQAALELRGLRAKKKKIASAIMEDIHAGYKFKC